MKIVTLNTWGGIAGVEGLMEFFKKHQDVDIFCLQEIFNGEEDKNFKHSEKKEYNLFNLIQKNLPDHIGFFRPHLKDIYGLALFTKKLFSVIEEGEYFVHKNKGYLPEDNYGFHARNIQFVKINDGKKEICVINFHGLWNGQGKGDTEDRIKQSENIVSFIKDLKTPYVLCGDFNLLPDTESLKMIESLDVRNLIKDYNITSTRTSFYDKDVKFADYAFASKDLKVINFQVLPDEVSDHSPLYLEVE